MKTSFLTSKAAIGGGAAAASAAAGTALTLHYSQPSTEEKSPEQSTLNKEDREKVTKPDLKDQVKETTPVLENNSKDLSTSEKKDQPPNAKQQPSIPQPKQPSFSSRLEINESDFYKAFNKPGDCIKKLFIGLTETNFFNTLNITKSTSDIKETQVFQSVTQNNPIDIACYTYNEKNNRARLEIGLIKNNEGWAWMAGLSPHNSYKKLWYREFILEKQSEKWKVKVAHEGEISPEVATNTMTSDQRKQLYQPAFGESWHGGFPQIWINTKTESPCKDNNCSHGVEVKAKIAYWKVKNAGNNLVMTAGNAGSQITRWKNDKTREKMYEGNNRKRVYKDGQWHNYTKPESKDKEKLIKLDDNNAATIKGEWKNIYGLCTDVSRKTNEKEAYNILCK